MKKVLIIGRGAVGNAFAPYFHKALGSDFAFLASKERKARYEKTPLIVNGEETHYRYICPEDDFGAADLILITTKRSGLEEALELAVPFMGPDTLLMSGINGIESEDVLRQAYPNHTVLRAIAQKMDSRYSSSQVSFTTSGELVFGPETEAQAEAAQKLAAFLSDIGFPYVLSQDIVHDAWKKLMFNCAINQICAVNKATYGDVIASPVLYDQLL